MHRREFLATTALSAADWGSPLIAADEPKFPKKARAVIRCEDAVLAGVAFSPDGKTLAVGCSTDYDETIRDFKAGEVRVWDVADCKLRIILKGHTAGVGPVANSSDGKLLASGSDDQTIRLWDARSGKLRAT